MLSRRAACRCCAGVGRATPPLLAAFDAPLEGSGVGVDAGNGGGAYVGRRPTAPVSTATSTVTPTTATSAASAQARHSAGGVGTAARSSAGACDSALDIGPDTVAVTATYGPRLGSQQR